MTPRRAWAGFWILGAIWGSSFLFIRIAVEELTTFQVVFLRTAIAACGLHAVRLMRGLPMPAEALGRRDLLVLGIVNTALPFALITWGEHVVDSGLAAVLQATAALFSAMVAHVVFQDERLTPRSVAGLLVAFAGVAVLGTRGVQGQQTSAGALQQVMGQAAIVLASLCYAIGGSYGRVAMQQRRHDPLVVAAGSMTVTAFITGIVVVVEAWSAGHVPSFAAMHARTIVAILTLGVLNTFAAYLIFYSVLRALGAAKAASVTYVIPPVGLVLGALVLGEPIDLWLGVGGGMILAGLTLIQVAPRTLAGRVSLAVRKRLLTSRA